MRRALLHGIEDHVHWGRRVVAVDLSTDPKRANLIFDDRTLVEGKMVVGIEGSRSITRQFLRPDAYSNQPLPIRFTGVAVDLIPEEIEPLRSMDPLLFQGCHPLTGTFFWFSMLETPQVNCTAGTGHERYRAQICMPWPVHTPEDEVSPTDEGRLRNMKRRAEGFVPFLRRAVNEIPEGTAVTEIKLADWECLDWDNNGGRVTLAGGAAHAMTMYRGEAANHGLLDAFHLAMAIDLIYSESTTPQNAIDCYEKEMRERTTRAVLSSRQACRDAHVWDQLNENSAILTKRSVVGS